MGYRITREELIEILEEPRQLAHNSPVDVADAILAKITEQDRCYGKSAEGEPIFVLRARDLTAPNAVVMWGIAAQTAGAPADKVAFAFAHADVMRVWQAEHKDHVKVPD